MLKKSLLTSLIKTLSVYTFLTTGIYYLVTHFSSVNSPLSPWFPPLNALFQVFLGLVIYLLRAYAVASDTGEPLAKLQIANKMTLLRLSLFPLIIFLFILTRSFPGLGIPLLVITAVAFLTDLLDGFLSRSLKQISNLGKILDSGSDYLLLFSLTLVFLAYGVLPIWLFIIILVRMGVQTLGMSWLTWRYKKLFLHTTLWGKVSFFALMVLYVFEIFVFFEFPGIAQSPFQITVEITAGALTLISFGDKVSYFWGQYRVEEASRAHGPQG